MKVILLTDIKGIGKKDDIVNVSNPVTMSDTYVMNVLGTSDENNRIWNYAYGTINTCNIFLENLEKYEARKYMRSAGALKAGDYVRYTFAEPLTCQRITVQTADPVNNFYGVTQGHVEVLYAGAEQYENVGSFDMYKRVTFSPSRPVSAVCLVVDGPCEGKAVSIQALIIE